MRVTYKKQTTKHTINGHIPRSIKPCHLQQHCLSSQSSVSENMRKLFSVFLILILLLQVFTEALSLASDVDSLANDDEGRDGVALLKTYHHKKINCTYACARRCRKSSRKNVCSRACKTCCARCHCVPPATYGHHNICPCYASLRTHGNKLKCP